MNTTLFIFVSLLIYFAPTLIASARNHNNFNSLFALNVFLGWSGLGWIGALVWSLIKK